MGALSFQQIVGFRNLDELTHKIDEFSYRVLKEGLLDLPDKSYTVRYVPLTLEQVRMYKDLQKEALILLEGGELVTAPQVITQMLRLQQVLSGTLEGQMMASIVEVPNQRLDALLDCIEASGKILICHASGMI